MHNMKICHLNKDPMDFHADPVETVIRKRRSIRKYKADMPPAEWIEAIVECASMAPSPSNIRPVRFVRLSSSGILEDLHQTMIQRRDELLRNLEAKGGPKKIRNLINVYFRYSEFMFHAPVIIGVGTILGAKSFSGKLAEAGVLPEDSRGETDLDISVGLALKGLLLKSEALGLGTCILTAPLVFLEGIEQRMGLEDLRIKCFVTVGFPDETPPLPERKRISEIFRNI
jgi:nitroreductase